MGGGSSKPDDSLPKLVATTEPIPGGANAVMGKWFVQSCVPTPFEKDVYVCVSHRAGSRTCSSAMIGGCFATFQRTPGEGTACYFGF